MTQSRSTRLLGARLVWKSFRLSAPSGVLSRPAFLLTVDFGIFSVATINIHTRGDAQMQFVNQVLSKTQPLRTGEIKLIDDKRAMCITPKASYGGGSGPLWAIEDMPYQFTTARHYGYLEGVCRQVLPSERCVVIEITKGDTWGHYKTGTWMKFHVANIHRFHSPSVEGDLLLQRCKRYQSSIASKKAFIDISTKELLAAIENGHHDGVKDKIGNDCYQYVRKVAWLYLQISKKHTGNNAGGKRMTVEKLISSLHRITCKS